MRVVTLSLIIVLGSFAFASADTTLNQPPDQVFGNNSDEGIGPPPIVFAENFTVITGGLGFALNQVVIWGGYRFTNDATTPDDFGVVIHSDAAGLPGAAICTETPITPTSRTATGLTWMGGTIVEYIVTLDLATACNLVDGSYWVEVYSTAGAGADNWFWESGTVDPVNGAANSSYTFRTPPDWYAAASESAIQLNGILLPVELQSFSIE